MTWMLWKTEHGIAEEESEKIQMNYKWVNWEKNKIIANFSLSLILSQKQNFETKL